MPSPNDFIVDQIKSQISDFKTEVEKKNANRILNISDGDALVDQ